LTVAIQIQLAKSEAAGDGLLEDASSDNHIVPCDLARKADVEGDELHLCGGLSGQGLDRAGTKPQAIRCWTYRKDTRGAQAPRRQDAGVDLRREIGRMAGLWQNSLF
jgi:hypothetical protein